MLRYNGEDSFRYFSRHRVQRIYGDMEKWNPRKCVITELLNLYFERKISFMLTFNIFNLCYSEMQPKEEYLRGLALVIYNTSKARKEVVSCPETDLPNNIHDRLKELFQIKAKWTPEEITPYIMYVESRKILLALSSSSPM